MPKKDINKRRMPQFDNAYIEGAGIVEKQIITETLEKNYMPYAMSVILSRALPEIDGFKPSHRKILYTMYKMGLLNGRLTKSANIVGSTMKLNPHGDAAIYETMVRLSRGYEALLHPYVESKGNFGKAYSRDMAYAASRYTEAKLSKICEELFLDIDKDTVDFTPNYDNTTKEPTLLPVTYPSILVNSNVGIAVSMASSICSFNLKEVCEAAIGIIKFKQYDIRESIKGPDFAGGGMLIYDEETFENIYKTGRGSFKVRSKYSYDKQNNCIDIVEIPPTTTIEAIMSKVAELVKQNKIREISDIRDETDLNGLKITIDLKRGIDPQKLMKKLYKSTPFEESYACNFNILIDGTPKVMGIEDILKNWHTFRSKCVKRRYLFELKKKKARLHLLKGLKKILIDIDKAVKIIRETDGEDEVVTNLMVGFGIDLIQAEFVAEIKLRHLNKEYIINKLKEIDRLEEEIKEHQVIVESPKKIDGIICKELKEVINKYGKPRKTMLLYLEEDDYATEEEDVPDYIVNLFITKDGYLKKIPPKSLKMNSEQKLKENDKVIYSSEQKNNVDMLFFTNKANVYKANLSIFTDTKASLLGDFIPAFLSFEEGEELIYSVETADYSGEILFFFENGKCAKISMLSYKTKTNRKKLANAYCLNSPLVSIFKEKTPRNYLLKSSDKKALIVDSSLVGKKSSRTSQGNYVMKFNKSCYLVKTSIYNVGDLENENKYKSKNLPAKGSKINPSDFSSQMKL